MNKRKLGSFALWAMLFALCQSASAQQPTKVPRIGWLRATPLSANADRIEALRKPMRAFEFSVTVIPPDVFPEIVFPSILADADCMTMIPLLPLF